MHRRSVVAIGIFVTVLSGLFVAQEKVQAAAERMADAPRFEVDPMWPKPLPNHWILGMVIGVGVDSRDHVFIVHRGNAASPGLIPRPLPPIQTFPL